MYKEILKFLRDIKSIPYWDREPGIENEKLNTMIRFMESITETHAEHEKTLEEIEFTDFYIYYSKGTNHDNADDVAITEACSLKEAIENFQKYYTNVSKDNVQIIDYNRSAL